MPSLFLQLTPIHVAIVMFEDEGGVARAALAKQAAAGVWAGGRAAACPAHGFKLAPVHNTAHCASI